ncbi:glycoside hydrolase family 65 protein [Demetria terragena]|uniref:glycoside hydrolase family 65 protein n=1 Tax=Demetria terragena TaxID=63959 RepID=UPI00037408F7|nr:glycosyl hydrolase family 65 protein [Demetria terragena]
MTAFGPITGDPLDRNRFPIDEWALVETRFEPSDLGVTETLFAVGNGYLGLRGNYEEARDAYADGTFVNGFHETWPIHHAEEAFGLARVGQTMVNAPDPKIIRLYIDDEPLELSTADLLDYQRVLDFRTGVLSRDLVWRTTSGKRVRVRSRRMTSFTERHLGVMQLEVTLLEGNAAVQLSSQLVNRQDRDVRSEQVEPAQGTIADPRKAEQFGRRVLQPQYKDLDEDAGRIALGYQTVDSGMTIGVVVDHHLDSPVPYRTEGRVEDDQGKLIYQIRAEEGHTIRLTKLVSVHTATRVPARELIDRCERTLDRANEDGVEAQFEAQREWLDAFWERSDVELPRQPDLQQATRWNLFALTQATARADGLGIPAKGVSAAGYGGHYFWDAEIYAMPFSTYTTPNATRNALRFRYSLLPAARRRAVDLSQKGALFPWRTINGNEASAYYAAGTAQYHIDADIAYAVSQYVGATGDLDFLVREGVDILVETARLWADIGFWRQENGSSSFHIHGVTGPDEYTTVVNDNLYTNVLARFNLRRAADAVTEVRESQPDAYDEVVRRTGLREEEIAEWREAAAGMHVPYDAKVGIHPQDSRFLDREMWDLEHTSADVRPLLLHHHPLVIYRFQVLKQADVVLAQFLQSEEFTTQEKRADFEYYDPITTGDSSLSAVVQSIIAAEVGYHELALQYFYEAAFVDLADRHANAADGVHVASTGGVWSALVCGFGGFRDHGAGRWHFDPRLPAGWDELSFRLTMRGTRIRVTVTSDALTAIVEDGEGEVTFSVRDTEVTAAPGRPVEVPLDGQGARIEGRPPNPAGTLRADGTVISATVPGR